MSEAKLMVEKSSRFPTLQVILASPYWGISGVNIFSANLVKGLIQAGIPSHILLSNLDYLNSEQLELEQNIPTTRLPVVQNNSWRSRWLNAIHYLEERKPCIYIPNADFWHSAISPKLSNHVGIVGIVHSDDPTHYEHVARLGKYWNVIVAVSETIAIKTAKIDPTFSERLVVIPHGVTCPSTYPLRTRAASNPIRVVYAGRLVCDQKRVLDLPKLVEAVLIQSIPIELSIIGSGSDQAQLIDASKHLVERGAIKFLDSLPNEKVLEYFQQSDVFILTSDFEGMPISLLEAMSRGCVPVVTNIDSGIPEIVQDGINGYRVPVGDIQQFAECLAELYRNPERCQEMSVNAYRTIKEGGYQIQDMVDKYIDVFHRVMQEMESGTYTRPHGRILRPPMLKGLWKNWLPKPIVEIVRSAKQSLIRGD
jgi:glycosyltransferase involved in cell wall biosynthesis